MFSFLLAIIYVSFISLGLPDSLLGAGWPVMQHSLNVPLSYAGIISMIIAIGTIISSLFSGFLTRKLNTGLLTALSVATTAIALFGFSVSDSFIALCLWAIPYGLGAGAVDSALNNYVALHYSSRHMNWLHAFWGVGVSISPYIMSFCLTRQLGWNIGYRSVSFLQIILTVVLFCSLPLWKKKTTESNREIETAAPLKTAIKAKGVTYCLVSFFCYCAFECTAGLWASSYMAGIRGVTADTAARFASMFYLGVTGGRFLSGIVADKLGDRKMIRIGGIVMLIGVAMIILPVKTNWVALLGLVIAGLGDAPIYPCIIHSTPTNFGTENSQALVGVQMASAYLGTTLMPPLFGVLADNISLSLYPFYLAVLALTMLVMTHSMNGVVDRNKQL